MTWSKAADVRSSGEREPHLKDYLRILSARRRIFLAVFVLVVLSVTVTVLVLPRIYRAQALILIQPADSVTTIEEVRDPGLSGGAASQEFYQTQYKLIVSRPALEKTFDYFGFGEMKEFLGEKDPLAKFAKRFSANPVARSRLLEVTFEWKDPRLASSALDYHVNEYIAFYRETSLESVKNKLEVLKREAAKLRSEFDAKSVELQQMHDKYGILVSLETTQGLLVKHLDETEGALSTIERTSAFYGEIITNMEGFLEGDLSLDEMLEVSDYETLHYLRSEYVAKKKERDEILGQYGPEHDDVIDLGEKLANIAETAKEEMKRTIAAVRAEVDILGKKKAELHKQRDEYRERIVELDKLGKSYTMLKQAQGTLYATYDAVTGRIGQMEVGLAASREDKDLLVVRAPAPPLKPYRPRRIMWIAVSCLIGALLGAGLCFFVDYLDTSIKTKKEAEQILGAPVIGSIPAIAAAQDLGSRQLVGQHSSCYPVAEAFQSVVAALSLCGKGKGCLSFLVTSAVPREGKTLVAFHLAAAFARTGKEVALVEADMRRPCLEERLRLDVTLGLRDVLEEDGVAYTRAMKEIAGLEGLRVLPCGAPPANPVKLLESDRMRSLVKRLAAEFDVVVFDAAPVVGFPDALVLGERVRNILVVLRAFWTEADAAQRALAMLARTRADTLAVILNNVDAPPAYTPCEHTSLYRGYQQPGGGG